MKPVRLLPGWARLSTMPSSNRIGHEYEYNRRGAGDALKRGRGQRTGGEEDVGLESNQLLRILTAGIGIAGIPAIVDLDVAAYCPAPSGQSLRKRCDSDRRILAVGSNVHQHADTSDLLGLLRLCEERPRNHTSSYGQELPPSHLNLSPPLSTEGKVAKIAVLKGNAASQ